MLVDPDYFGVDIHQTILQNRQMSKIFEKLVPALFVITIGLAFLVGVLWQKVENVGKGSSVNVDTTGTAEVTKTSPISVDNLKIIAKDLGLDTKKFNSCLDDGQKIDVVSKDSAYGGTVGVRGTPGFFINGRFLGGAFPFTSFKEVIDRELEGKGSNDFKSYSTDLQNANAQGSFIATPKDINIEGAHLLGDPNAKVVLVDFSDYECPYCIRHFNQTWPDIKKNYVDTGKIKVVFKNFPLNFHPNAQKAAEAAECASDQGKFWEMHDKIFSASPAS